MQWRLKDLLVGDWRDTWFSYHFPLLPWFGLYLVASAAGVLFTRADREGTEAALPRRVAVLGTSLILAGVTLHVEAPSLADATPTIAFALAHFAALRKLPPSPTFLLVYVGATCLLLAGLMWAQHTRVGRAIGDFIVPFGRNSLPAFVLQSFVYMVAVVLLPRPPQILMPVYFIITVIALRAAVMLWERKNWNRFLTVGYCAFVRRWAEDKTPAQARRPEAFPQRSEPRLSAPDVEIAPTSTMN
jgi:uncharacterized membrane protein